MANLPRIGGARAVASGILTSRLLGFVRERCLAQVFGASAFADVFAAALRAPNLLQNLLGEQTLSASFIPVYTRLLESRGREAAGRFAGAVLGLLAALCLVLVVLGVVFAPQIVALFVAGFLKDAAAVAAGELEVDRYQLTVRAVRVIFPMTGLLVFSAWALGILNSHRRFFLSYFAPALWNLAIIGALVAGSTVWWPVTNLTGDHRLERVLLGACFGALVGALLQLGIQLPSVWRLAGPLRPSLNRQVEGVKEATSAFVPLVLGRGVVQLSGYLDAMLASFLLPGAIAALRYSQILVLLPISLFGMSLAAAELPELSRGKPADAQEWAARTRTSLSQSAFLTVPTAVGYLILGYFIVGGLFRGGEFGKGDNWLVALVLAGYSLGLVANTSSRLVSNLFYASGQTKTPARIAVFRVLASACLGTLLMLRLDQVAVASLFQISSSDLHLGAVGLALGAATGAWLELLLLLRAARRLVGGVLSFPWAKVAGLTLLALLCAGPWFWAWKWLEGLRPWFSALIVMAGLGGSYIGFSWLVGIPEAKALFTYFRKRSRSSS